MFSEMISCNSVITTFCTIPINIIIVMFGLSVAILMLVLIRWNQANIKRDPSLLARIGEHGQGQAL